MQIKSMNNVHEVFCVATYHGNIGTIKNCPKAFKDVKYLKIIYKG